jgi:hypothetical protein
MDARARLTWAVRNNANWCDLVCRSHRIPTSFRPELWTTTQPAPRFYPDAVTLQADVAEHHILAAIAPRPDASVKDSFATLDFDRHGFTQLFEARWITHDPTPARSDWTVAHTEAELNEWTEAAGLTGIIGPALARESKVCFLLARDQGGIGAGAVANLTGAVVGISNVFTTTIDEDEAWADMPAAVHAAFPNAVLVGYEHGTGLRAAIAAGFRDLGPLRVWVAT